MFSIRFAALKSTMSVFQVHDETEERDAKQRRCIADVMFLLIPKIVSTLTNVAVGRNSFIESHRKVNTLTFNFYFNQ